MLVKLVATAGTIAKRLLTTALLCACQSISSLAGVLECTQVGQPDLVAMQSYQSWWSSLQAPHPDCR